MQKFPQALSTEDNNPGPLLFKHSNHEQETDLAIWKAFKNGNRKALDFIFEKYSRMLYLYGSRFTPRKDVVEDSIQDVFVELWTKRETLSDTTSIKLYLFKSLRRRVVKMIQRDHRKSAIAEDVLKGEDQADFSYEIHWIAEETDAHQQQQLQKAIEGLTRRQREAIYLKYYEQMTNESIASTMNLTIPSTYALIGKAIALLRAACC